MKTKILHLLRRLDDAIYEKFGPIRVIFFVMNDYGFACQLPLIKMMLLDSRFKVLITSRGEISYPDQTTSDELNNHYISYSRASWIKTHYVIYTDVPDLYLRRNHISISTAHGAAFGNVDYAEMMSCHPVVDIIFGNETTMSTRLEEYQPGVISTKEKLFFSTGFMKCDDLFNRKFDREQLLSGYNLDKTKQTIVVASHWTPNSILRALGIALADKICTEFPNCNVIQTGHDNLWKNPTFYSPNASDEPKKTFDSNRLIDELQKLEQKHTNFRFIPTGLIHPLARPRVCAPVFHLK